jgi:hypothetical protein
MIHSCYFTLPLNCKFIRNFLFKLWKSTAIYPQLPDVESTLKIRYSSFRPEILLW